MTSDKLKRLDTAPLVLRLRHRLSSEIWELGSPVLHVHRDTDGSVRLLIEQNYQGSRTFAAGVDLDPEDATLLSRALVDGRRR